MVAAIIQNSVVTNIIHVNEENLPEFPTAQDAAPMGLSIGDFFDAGEWWRMGEQGIPVMLPLIEDAEQDEMAQALDLLGVNVNG